MAMPSKETFEYLVSRWTDELVITSAGNVSVHWYDLTHDTERVFYLDASMSLVSMFTAGIAIGLPQQKFWAFTGDGAFAMNPGMLMVERQMGLPNITHFLVSNRVYAATEQVAMPNIEGNDYATVARGFGIPRVWSFDHLDTLKAEFDNILEAPGPKFVVLEVDPTPSRIKHGTPVDTWELKYRFGRHIEKKWGIKVFDFE
jgi:thiamine pyrophosphate-dependent acetolactate synthase large subunit-like protein